MTTLETRVVDTVPRRASVDVSDTEMVEAALNREEGKMVDDEEIDSCEGEDLEEQMLTVALVKSVVDSGAHKNQDNNGQQSPRYGLRKRRRPGDVSPNVKNSRPCGETKQAPAHGRAAGPTATITNGRLSLLGPVVSVSIEDENLHLKKQDSSSASGNEDTRTRSIGGHRIRDSATRAASAPKETAVKKEMSGPRTIAPSKPLIQPTTRQSQAIVPRKTEDKGPTRDKKSIPAKARAGRPSLKVKSTATTTALVASPSIGLVPTSGAVPNPLLQSIQSSSPISDSYCSDAKNTTSEANNQVSTVPCPLPAPVPCPLQQQDLAFAKADKKVKISEPPIQPTRSRIFSVDLDPATFDFSDLAGDHIDPDKSDTETNDMVGPPPPSDELSDFKRDRAFSFEFFHFASDDLLSSSSTQLPEGPDPVHSNSIRPRGDSIIYDPASFQDGGIHEKNAIMKVNAAKRLDGTASSMLDDSMDTSSAAVADGVISQQTRNTLQPQPPNIVASSCMTLMDTDGNESSYEESHSENGQLATLPSGLADGNSNGTTTPATFQMELLNKDGRIGIYLPDARKARIARFHAKRKMRIWRKRIKYDCRKKLADSRPRIKGRFVKRTDTDE